MATYRAQVTLAMKSGIPDDQATNTFHFSSVAPTDPEMYTLFASIVDFYDDLKAYLSPQIATAGHRFKLYDLSDPEPRVPVFDEPWNFSAAISTANAALPAECAAVLSFRGTQSSGLNMARRRGRIYFGPLNNTVLAADANYRMMLSTTFRTAVLAQLVELANDSGLTNFVFGVWSPTSSTFTDAVIGWMDNAVDTMRSRGPAATERIFSAAL